MQYSVQQEEARRTRDYLAEGHNMEIDQFGLARFRQAPAPARNHGATDNANIDIPDAQPGSASPASAYFG